MRLSISPGNKKIGRTPNISLPPRVSCSPSAPCQKDCYALKAYRMYPQSRTAWTNNYTLYNADPVDYFRQLNIFLTRTRKTVFRYHVSGDIPDQSYLDNMISIADLFPHIIFFTYTKKYDLNFANLPSNLKIRISAWPHYLFHNLFNLPVTYMQDGTETRIPDVYAQCPGSCATCQICWTSDVPVVINKH